MPYYLAIALCCLLTLITSDNNWASLSDLDQSHGSLSDRFLNNPALLRDSPNLTKQLNTDAYRHLLNDLNLTPFTFLYPMIVKGETLNLPIDTPSALPSIDSLSLMVLKNGLFVPIPFQIDELDTVGWIYIQNRSESPINGTPNHLDAQDELVFMYRDATFEQFDKAKHSLTEGSLLREIKLSQSHMADRYIYLVANNTQRSRVRYVDFDIQSGKGDSTFYQFQSNKKNFMQLENFQAKLGSEAGKNIFKKLHVELSSSLFAHWARIQLNSEKHIRPRAIAVKNGPIRSCILLDVRIYFAGIRLFGLPGQVNLYEQSINLPNRSPVKAVTLFKKIFVNPKLSFTIDFNNMLGATVATQSLATRFTIDGQMSAIETSIDKQLQLGGWVWLNSNKGWDLFISNNMPPAALEGLQGNIIYKDQVSLEYANEAHPSIGFEISGTPTNLQLLGHLETQTDLWFPFSLRSMPDEFNDDLQNPPTISTSAI